jgi:hypothetical protein
MTDRTVSSTSPSHSANAAASLAATGASENQASATTPAAALRDYVDLLKQASPVDAGTMLRSMDAITRDRAQTDAITAGGTHINIVACDTLTMPGFPVPPAADAGAGVHGAVEPTRLDRLTEQAIQTATSIASANGLPNAARHLQHFLDNSGSTLQVDPNAMRADAPNIAQQMDASFSKDIMIRAEAFVRENYTGQPMCFTMESGWTSAKFNRDISNDWFLGIGGFSYAHTATAAVTPQSTGAGLLSIDSQVHVFDPYNWDGNKATPIGGFVISDTTLGRLHATGLAQEYDIRGTAALPEYQNYIFTSSGAPNP